MRQFAPGWGMTLAVAVLLPVLLGLGAWQLERGAEKRAYQSRYFDRIGMPPRAVPTTLAGSDYRRVRIEGEYLRGRDYLLDNRVHDGRPGYWVVSHFRAADGRVFLVNRGWIQAPASRDQLPAVTTPTGRVTLLGVIWPDTGLAPLLAPDDWSQQWPKRVQRLDVARMARHLDAVVAAEVRLEPGQPGVFRAAPLAAEFGAERHDGYAVQWFGLALTLAAGYLIFGFRRS